MIPIITSQELKHKLDQGEELSVIDVREVEEVAEGKIPNATHISLSTLPARLFEIDRNKEHILVCRSGARSERACEFLHDQGYKVKNLVGGMLGWEGPVEK